MTILRELERFDIEFCEQPIPAGHPHAAARDSRPREHPDRRRRGLPTSPQILPALYGCVDGVNVKLAKTGGIRGALAMIHTARAMGMKVMLGCMVESAIAATAAAHISPLVDWADLDGPLSIAHDPFAGVAYDRGKVLLPDAPGLGVSRKRGRVSRKYAILALDRFEPMRRPRTASSVRKRRRRCGDRSVVGRVATRATCFHTWTATRRSLPALPKRCSTLPPRC